MIQCKSKSFCLSKDCVLDFSCLQRLESWCMQWCLVPTLTWSPRYRVWTQQASPTDWALSPLQDS